jgi:CheY-like chemotaxis protein
VLNSSDKPTLLIISNSIEYPRLFQVLATKLEVSVVPVKGTPDDLVDLDAFAPDLIIMDWLDQRKDRSFCVQRIRSWNEQRQKHTPILTVASPLR